MWDTSALPCIFCTTKNLWWCLYYFVKNVTYISKTSNWFKKRPNGFQVKVVDIRGWIWQGKGDLVCKRKLGRKSSESRRPLARPMGGRWSIIVVLDNRRNPSAGHEIYSSIGWSGYVWHKKGLYRSDPQQGSVVCMSKSNQYPVQCYEKTWQKPSYMIFHSSQWLRHDCVVWSIFVQASLTFNNQKIKRHEMKSRLLICLLLEINLEVEGQSLFANIQMQEWWPLVIDQPKSRKSNRKWNSYQAKWKLYISTCW